jgi:hypothetical protein
MSTIRHRSNRLPLHAARRAAMRSVMSMVTSRAVRVRSHSAARTISSIKWRAAPATTLMCAPARLAREDCVMEAIEGAGACAVDERCVAQEGDVVEAEVPDGGVDHAVGGKGHHCTDYGTGEDIVPGQVSNCRKYWCVGWLTSCGTRQW